MTQLDLMQEKIRHILDKVKLEQKSWGSDATVMTFNGYPIGGAMKSKDIYIHYWWPELKEKLVDEIAAEMVVNSGSKQSLCK